MYYYWIASTFQYFSIWFRKPILSNILYTSEKWISHGFAVVSGSEQSKASCSLLWQELLCCYSNMTTSKASTELLQCIGTTAETSHTLCLPLIPGIALPLHLQPQQTVCLQSELRIFFQIHVRSLKLPSAEIPFPVASISSLAKFTFNPCLLLKHFQIKSSLDHRVCCPSPFLVVFLFVYLFVWLVFNLFEESGGSFFVCF